MIKLIADATLPDLSEWFQHPFQLTRVNPEINLYEQLADCEVLLCRSTLQLDMNLLAHTKLRCIATCSSGTDHIARSDANTSIQILDAKGANARAVADYVIACLAYCQQQGVGRRAQAGVVGLGAVGSAVAERLQGLGFALCTFDPLRAMVDANFSSCEWEALLDCDLITVHANLHDTPPYASRHLLGSAFLSKLKAGTVLINAARGDILDEQALLACPHLHYCTDVYASEPQPNPDVVAYATLCTPHIAGHSMEARNRILRLVCQKIHHFFGLQPPAEPDLSQNSFPQGPQCSSWQAAILALYNPEVETKFLKQATDLRTAFLTVRSAHCLRHEFDQYGWPDRDPLVMAAVGG